MRVIWAYRLPEPWKCPRCGVLNIHGSRRSLWSLLPWMCRHVVLDWRSRVDEHGMDPDTNGLEELEVRHSCPIMEGGWRGWLRQRLLDEQKRIRRYWWLPLVANERHARQHMRDSMPTFPFAPWGRR